MKLRILTIIALMLVIGLGAGGKGCGKKSTGTGGGGAGSDWEFVKSVSSTWILLPDTRPQLVSGPRAVKIYSSVNLTQATMDEMVVGVKDTLYRSNWNNPRFTPADWWRTVGKPFSRLEDYAIIVKPPDGQSQSAEHRGCGLLHVRAGDVVTAIGTNAGQIIINGIPRAPGGLYLVIAGPAANEPAESNCDVLRRRGTAAEAEHARAMGAPDIWFWLQELDFGAGHPGFIGPNGEGMAFGEIRRPDGSYARADYAPFAPSMKQIPSVNLSPEDLNDLQQRYPNLADAWRDERIQRQLAE